MEMILFYSSIETFPLLRGFSELFCLPVSLSWEAWIEPVMSILSILCLAPELPRTTGLVRVIDSKLFSQSWKSVNIFKIL